MFSSAVARLTFIYVVILLGISLFFSYNWYSVANTELTRDARRGGRSLLIDQLQQNGQNIDQSILDRYAAEIDESLKEARGNIIARILIANIFILGAGGVGCYFLARRTLKPLEEAHEAQKRFTADASHELRTPLAAIRSQIEVKLRKKKRTREETDKLLESAVEELDKLTGLSDSLLQLAENDKGAKLDLKAVNVRELVADVVARSKQRAAAKNIELIDALEEISVLGDEPALEQLLMILIDNAIKYSRTEGRITVGAEKTGGETVLYVRDTGIGIKASDIPHLFDRFYRADNSRQKITENGYGLGLSIAQGIARLHDAKIEVESTPGKGSTFSIKLTTA